MILEQCKGVHYVDLGESFQTHIYLQNFVSIQPRTSPVKFAAAGRATRGGEQRRAVRAAAETCGSAKAAAGWTNQSAATRTSLHILPKLAHFGQICNKMQ